MFIEVRIVSPAVELESIIYEDSLGQKHQTILYFYGTIARRRHRHGALLQSSRHATKMFLRKLKSSLLNETHLWTHHWNKARKLRLVQSCCTKKECRTIGHSFRLSISSAVAGAASSPIGFISSFEDALNRRWNSQINILVGDVAILVERFL